jgi:hypothetical protein
MAKDGLRLTRIVIAIVAKKDNFTANFGLEPPGRQDFGGKKPFRKESARLLAEANDRGRNHRKRRIATIGANSFGCAPASWSAVASIARHRFRMAFTFQSRIIFLVSHDFSKAVSSRRSGQSKTIR